MSAENINKIKPKLILSKPKLVVLKPELAPTASVPSESDKTEIKLSKIPPMTKDENKNNEVFIACLPKWLEFAKSLPLGKNGGVDNKVLRERSKSNLLKDCRPDLYEQLDLENYKGEKGLENLCCSSQSKLPWKCYCGKRWLAGPGSRGRVNHSACIDCTREIRGKSKLTQDTVKKRFADHGYELLGKYSTYDTPCEVRHIKCGNIIMKKLCNVQYDCGCSINKSKKLSQSEAKNRFSMHGYELIDLYVGYNNPCKVIHLECGREIMVALGNARSECCKLCFTKRCRGSLSYSQNKAEEIFLSHGYKLLETYINNATSCKVIHLECGLETTKKLGTLGCYGCKNCFDLKKVSQGHRNVIKYLEDRKIDFTTEVGLEGIGKRKFDFLVGKNVLIEFDGEQHFQDSLWDRDVDKLPIRQSSDVFKTYAAILSGYTLIRLHKNHIYKIEKFLDYCLSQIQTQPLLFVDDLHKYSYIIDKVSSSDVIQELGVFGKELPNIKTITRTMP